jgi:superfamily II DNA or RNA helicase
MHLLRPYQREAANAAWKAFKEFRKQLMVLPTGSGKTVIFARMAGHPELQPALILAHRDELVNQAVERLKETTGIEASIEKASSNGSRTAPVVVGSIQTLAGVERLETWPNDHFKFVVIDEAHHALSDTWQRVIEHFPSAKILGVTATPHRGDKKNLGKYFENVCYELSLLDLVHQGYLCPIKIRTVPLKIDLSSLRKKLGDYSEADSGALLEPLLEKLGETIKEYADDKKSLIFLPLRHTSRKLCSVLQSLGLKAEHIDGDDPDRKQKLEDFKSGKITHLCNAMLLTEGYDEPSIECIIPLRPTTSQPLYAQMVGRGTRNSPGKDCLLILDYLWLHEQHSLIRPAHLIAESDEIADAMTRMSEEAGREDSWPGGGDDGELDLEGMHGSAVEEREETLRRRLEEKASRESKTINALEYALDVKELALADYEPTMPWESLPPTMRQLEILAKVGIAPESITCRGHASKVMGTVFFRTRNRLATAKQVYWLARYGHPHPNTVTMEEASKFLSKRWGKERNGE